MNSKEFWTLIGTLFPKEENLDASKYTEEKWQTKKPIKIENLI